MNANPTLPDAFANAIHPMGKEEKRRPVFDKKTVAGAWLSFLVGYLYCRAFFIWQKPVSGLIFTVLLFAFALVLRRLRVGLRLRRGGLMRCISTCMSSRVNMEAGLISTAAACEAFSASSTIFCNKVEYSAASVPMPASVSRVCSCSRWRNMHIQFSSGPAVRLVMMASGKLLRHFSTLRSCARRVRSLQPAAAASNM